MGLAIVKTHTTNFLPETAALVLMTLFSLHANAQLTESEVLRLGLQNPQINALLDAQLEKARGKLQSAGRWDNPSFEYAREDMELPAGSSEETTLWLRQTINIAGVTGLQRKAANKAFEAETFQQAMERRHLQKMLREAFYKTLAAQQSSAAIEALQTQLQTIRDRVNQREARGDASRFDALRMEKELSVVLSQHAHAAAKFNELYNSLFVTIDAPRQTLQGKLLPTGTVAATFQASRYPQLEAMQSLLQSAELSARAAAREQWPELTLGVGRTESREPGFEADGNNISIGISIPLFDNGRGERQLAQSTARELKAESSLLERKLQAAYDSALHTYQANMNAASRLENMGVNSGHSLTRLAETSYQAGELGIMELLDACRADLQTTEQSIASALAARLAYIQLQFLQGE